ncbi:MAG: DegV family protein [Lachnospiraceae bacterium]|nr:DegV family protein [Lachnospiraceae bacterium]MDY3818490.1 DegV family protein [Lachnospiraceae bacterium]
MSYKIIIDSCGELTADQKMDSHFENVALQLDVDDYHILDDETFNQQEFLQKVKESPNCPKSSCPSPDKYIDAFGEDATHIYIVTLSSQLSGSYNSAVLAKQMYEEGQQENGDMPRQIHVFDSRSASIGETLIGMKVQELEEAGESFETIVESVENYIEEMNTFFVLETLETLRKNGRLSNIKAMIVNVLNIKPIMGSTNEGTIQVLGQARGMNKALDSMVQKIIATTKNCEEKILAISHCNCPKRAEKVKEQIENMAKFKKIIILETAGVSSMYANDGGVIVAV